MAICLGVVIVGVMLGGEELAAEFFSIGLFFAQKLPASTADVGIGLLPVFEIGAAFAVLDDEHAEGLHVEAFGTDVIGLDAHLHVGEDMEPLAVGLVDEDVAGLEIAVGDIQPK